MKTFILACLGCAMVGCGHQSGGSGSQAGSPGGAALPPAGAPIASPLKYYNHFAFNNVYTLPVQVGDQTLETVLDTGSSNLLLIGDTALCSGCQNEYGYNSTYASDSGTKELSTAWSMSFAPIGAATVQGYSDAVSFGGLTLPDFAFGVVTAEQGIPNIWGIAYPQLAKPGGAPQTPLFDALVAAGNLANEFSLRLCALKSGSTVTLGGYDAGVTAQLAAAQWTPITGKIWYSVGVSRLHIDASASVATSWSWQPQAGDLVIVDSGTNPLVIPEDEIAPLVAVLQAAAAKNGVTLPASFWPTASSAGGFAPLTAAQIATFPPLLVDLPSAADASQTFTLTVAPSTYIQTREDGQRFLGIQGGPSPTYILGTVFMENFVVLHARGQSGDLSAPDPTARLGFLPNTGLCH